MAGETPAEAEAKPTGRAAAMAAVKLAPFSGEILLPPEPGIKPDGSVPSAFAADVVAVELQVATSAAGAPEGLPRWSALAPAGAD